MTKIFYLENSDFSQDGKLLINSDKMVVILLQADFCGYCKQFKPEFDKVVSALGKKVNFATIKIDDDKELGKRIGQFIPEFKGVPTVVLFQAGKYMETYNGDRKADALIEYLHGYVS
jgi:thioredoxin-like negative regulator of GroEL